MKSSTRPGVTPSPTGITSASPSRALPEKVNKDEAYRNAKRNSPRQNAEIESNAAMRRLVTSMLRSHTELYRKYTEDSDFRVWLNRQVFDISYRMDEQGNLN